MNSKSKWLENCTTDQTDGSKPINPTEYQIFVGGLNSTVNVRQLRSIFEQNIGPVRYVTVLKDRDGRSRGFGRVQFVSKDSVNKAMEIGVIMIADTMVKLRRVLDKKEAVPNAKLLFRKKVILFGIQKSISHQHLESYFKAFGEIEKSEIFEETPEGHDLRQGFVQFSDET